MVAPYVDIIHKIQNEYKVDQSIELSIRTKASPKDILKEGGEPLLLELLQGISIELRINLWKKFADVILKLVEAGEVDPSLLPIMGGISPLFLLRLNGSIDMTIDDYMKTKITENPLVEPVLLDANTLLQSMFSQNVEDTEEFLVWVQDNVPSPFDTIAKLQSKYLGSELELQVGSEIGGLRINLDGEGLVLLARTLLLLKFT